MVEIQVFVFACFGSINSKGSYSDFHVYISVKTAFNTRNFSSGNDATHAIVELQDEGSSAVIPLARLRNADATLLKEGQDVEVVWNAGKKYKAQIKMLGKL